MKFKVGQPIIAITNNDFYITKGKKYTALDPVNSGINHPAYWTETTVIIRDDEGDVRRRSLSEFKALICDTELERVIWGIE